MAGHSDASQEMMMDSRQAIAILMLGLSTSVAQAQSASSPDGDSQRRRLIEQKARLVESLVNSPAAQGAAYGREAETPALLQVGRTLLAQAREALQAQRFDEANSALDDALRQASKASARLSARGDALSASALQSSYRSLDEQVSTYLAAIDDMSRTGSSEAKGISARIGSMRSEASRFMESGRLGDANRRLGEAYRLAVESLSRLRAGQTVTLSLKFDTPAEEYAYELKRFHSSEILVNMTLDEGRANGDRRTLVDENFRNGIRLRDSAIKQAENGDYRAAIAGMEQATAQLNRALQVMGIPIF
jgi:hypothetical protein